MHCSGTVSKIYVYVCGSESRHCSPWLQGALACGLTAVTVLEVKDIDVTLSCMGETPQVQLDTQVRRGVRCRNPFRCSQRLAQLHVVFKYSIYDYISPSLPLSRATVTVAFSVTWLESENVHHSLLLAQGLRVKRMKWRKWMHFLLHSHLHL